MSEKKLTKTMNKLRKLEGNKKCASCTATSESPLGYMNVVPKYKIFVCNMCKSALQSYSVRVKSVSQSTFDADEVDSFKAKHGGGNDEAKKIWFARLDREMPGPLNSNLDQYKRFIEQAFLQGRWKGGSRNDDDDNDNDTDDDFSSGHKEKKKKKKKKEKKSSKKDKDKDNNDATKGNGGNGNERYRRRRQ